MATQYDHGQNFAYEQYISPGESENHIINARATFNILQWLVNQE